VWLFNQKANIILTSAVPSSWYGLNSAEKALAGILIDMTQAEALEILKMGNNVFLTGQPGAGKTYLLNQYIKYLDAHHVTAAVTASTGIAATHIGGTTIHSWTGIGIRKGLSARQLDELLQREYLVKRMEKTKVLIIDEISMLDGIMLDDIDQVCKMLRYNHEPFGGLQVIFVGDFFQLPPISRNNQTSFAFQSNSWKEARLAYCYLSEQHRQTDGMFFSILTQLRTGNLDPDAYEALMEARHRTFDDGIEPVRIYTHNLDVDKVNQERLDSLEGDSKNFKMNTLGKKNQVERLKKSCLSPEYLELKEGAVVMCTKNNFDLGYVNGTMGTVLGHDDAGMPIIESTTGKRYTMPRAEWAYEDEGKTIAAITQIPLRLAWAITVHKSQGMSIDRAEMDLSQTFEYGQGYVALSRVRSLEGLRLLGMNERALMVHPTILENDGRFQKLSEAAATRLAEIDQKEKESIQKDWLLSVGGQLEEDKDVEVKKKEKKSNKNTYQKTLDLIMEEKTLEEIITKRELKAETVLSHLETLIERKAAEAEDMRYLIADWEPGNLEEIQEAFMESGGDKLSPVRSLMDNKYSFIELRLGRLFL
jgi:hypothetical protein